MELQEHKVKKVHSQLKYYIYSIYCIYFSGRHPCLWCIVQSNAMKVPREERGRSEPRTLDSLQADYLRFQTTGKGDLKQAKFFNNAIRPIFFDIPINQVRLQRLSMYIYI